MGKKRRLVYNDDGMGIGHGPADKPVESLREWIDRVCDHLRLDTIALSLATPDIVFYPSQVGETLGGRWANVDDVQPDHMQSISRRIRALSALGTDPIAVLAERVHEHGVELFAEMRMADTHHVSLDLSYPLVPQFTADHPEWIIRRSDTLPEGIRETALDYSFPEVRARRLAILREMAERPEVDGLELNFIRWVKFFVREEAPDKTHIMTDFLGQVHGMLAEVAGKRAHPLPLGVRVPSTLEESRLAGLDPKTWVENGWLDYLIAADFNYSDPQIPAEEYAAFTKATKCSLLCQMGDMIGGTWQGKPSLKDRDRGLAIVGDNYHGVLNTDAEARATAYNAYAWGADGIGFWNTCCNMHDHTGKWRGPEHRARMMSWHNAVRDRDSVLAGPRHYHFLPMYKWMDVPHRNYAVNAQHHSPNGGQHCQILTFSPGAAGRRQAYAFRMADGRGGEAMVGAMRFQIFHVAPDDKVGVDINGAEVPPAAVRRDYRPQADPPTTWFEISLADCPAFGGLNELGITVQAAADKADDPYMEELEVVVESVT